MFFWRGAYGDLTYGIAVWPFLPGALALGIAASFGPPRLSSVRPGLVTLLLVGPFAIIGALLAWQAWDGLKSLRGDSGPWVLLVFAPVLAAEVAASLAAGLWLALVTTDAARQRRWGAGLLFSQVPLAAAVVALAAGTLPARVVPDGPPALHLGRPAQVRARGLPDEYTWRGAVVDVSTQQPGPVSVTLQVRHLLLAAKAYVTFEVGEELADPQFPLRVGTRSELSATVTNHQQLFIIFPFPVDRPEKTLTMSVARTYVRHGGGLRTFGVDVTGALTFHFEAYAVGGKTFGTTQGAVWEVIGAPPEQPWPTQGDVGAGLKPCTFNALPNTQCLCDSISPVEVPALRECRAFWGRGRLALTELAVIAFTGGVYFQTGTGMALRWNSTVAGAPDAESAPVAAR